MLQLFNNFLRQWVQLYDSFEIRWQKLQASKIISNTVILFFFIGIVISLLSHYQIINLKVGRFFAIELAFSILLLSEIFDLIFILTHSVADSIGKQFEIVSLILLRNAFKELGHLPLTINWNKETMLALFPLIADAFGAVIIFLITVLFYRVQKHVQITKNAKEKASFFMQKKLIASVLLVVFIGLWIYDGVNYIATGVFTNIFSIYYTALIFSDILILIISLRYSNLYIHLFRYSSFALATVIIRISLSAPKYFNVLLTIAAGLFVLLVSNIYNSLNKNEVIVEEVPFLKSDRI
jgi:hypothetical protein